MRFSSLVFMAAMAGLAGCESRRDALVDAGAAGDAAPPGDARAPVDGGLGAGEDAWVCTSPVFTPATVTGTSPGGSLDGFRYAYAGFVTGFCPSSYLVNFTPDQVGPDCALVPWLQLAIDTKATGAGTHGASASLPNLSLFTDQVTFEATTLDPPNATTPHIVGRFVSHDPAWTFDIAVDVTSQFSTNCL